MPPVLIEWLQLLFRWIHVLAAILWIGDSFLFMWMDTHLSRPTRPREGAVAGELWMVHSGGFYEVVKRRSLAPSEVPPALHWFKWEAYTTWWSGFLLLGVVYGLGGGALLVDAGSTTLSPRLAFAGAIGVLGLAWLVYDALWTSPLARRPRVAIAISAALLVALAWGLTRAYSGRAAFLLAGATLGTIMAANVWRRIIPAQNRMLAATRAGGAMDESLGARAKTRSIHNHYLTLPVLFTMISNHVPSTWGHPLSWIVLLLLVTVGVVAKYVMNARGRSHKGVIALGLAALLAVVTMTTRSSGSAADPTLAAAAAVSFPTARAILDRRCVTCHATRPSNPSFPQPPAGVTFERPERIRQLAPRILARAVVTRTMPLGNLTGMTEEERRTLGAWIAQGARLEEGGP